MSAPVPAPSGGVEWKVKAATAASYVFGVVALWLFQLLGDASFVDSYSSYLPPTLSAFVLPLVPALAAFGAGWITKHTPRSAGLGDNVDAVIAERIEVALAEAEARVRHTGGSNTAVASSAGVLAPGADK